MITRGRREKRRSTRAQGRGFVGFQVLKKHEVDETQKSVNQRKRQKKFAGSEGFGKNTANWTLPK